MQRFWEDLLLSEFQLFVAVLNELNWDLGYFYIRHVLWDFGECFSEYEWCDTQNDIQNFI